MSDQGVSQNMTASLIYKLCSHVMNQPVDSVTPAYSFVVRALSKAPTLHDLDEFVTCEKIKKALVKQGRQKDALTFSELHRKLQSSPLLKKRCSILTLFSQLQDTDKQYNRYAQFASELARIAAASPEIALHASDIIRVKPQTSKMCIDQLSCDDIKKLTRLQCKEFKYQQDRKTDAFIESQKKVSHLNAVFSRKCESDAGNFMSCLSVKCGKKPPTAPKPEVESKYVNIIAQKDIMRDILYMVQGISGNNVNWKQERNNFTLCTKETVNNAIRNIVLRFSELGWMYLRISEFCKVQSGEKSLGLVGQSFVAALQEELIEYYRVLAILQAHLNEEISKDSQASVHLTLHRLSVWFLDCMLHLKVLASLVDACTDKKGGALASVLFSHLQHGDKAVQSPVRRILTTTIQPFYRMVSNWIFCGELEDVFSEFLVTANNNVSDNTMWHEKYSLNKSMIPSFFTMEQARKILSTGKAINFLRQVCKDHSFVKDTERSKKYHDSKKVESLFTQESDGEFQLLLEHNYIKTSSLVINVLYNDYKLMEHFQAMRNYYLLGQGDFIRHLMDLLTDELAKPANTLHLHNLSGILESAVRATNAQYHNPEILERLDVKLLQPSVGDTGWDVFSINYHVNGPISTVFTLQSMSSYLRLFSNLWKAKHMEYVLSNISQSRTMYLKIQSRIPEVTPVTFQCHVILSQMVHFIQQIQYYVAFEVMECCWADLTQKIQSAKDLDHIISAHEIFLDTLMTRSLLSEESLALRNQLKAIYVLILRFDKIQDEFWSQARALTCAEDEREVCTNVKTRSGTWGIDNKMVKDYERKLEKLKKKTIPDTKTQLRLLAYSYEDMVQKFLLMLNDHDDPNLRFLSFRLDFNEHFKNRNKRLHTSLTYLHRRQSLKHL